MFSSLINCWLKLLFVITVNSGYFSSAREALAMIDSISNSDFKNSIEQAYENILWIQGY